VVPEVNPDALKQWPGSGVIANPNCSTIQLVVSLAPLAKDFGLRSVQVVTLQSVSGAGQKGIDDLIAGAKDGQNPKHLPRPIVGNVIPAIDVFSPEGHCYEEEKIIRETRKILSISDLPVIATTTRVPTKIGHCEAVTVELQQEVDRQRLHESFRRAAGINFVEKDSYESFPTLEQWEGRPDVLVCRARLPLDQSRAKLIQYRNVADNLAKGAATNAVQIMQLLS